MQYILTEDEYNELKNKSEQTASWIGNILNEVFYTMGAGINRDALIKDFADRLQGLYGSGYLETTLREMDAANKSRNRIPTYPNGDEY